MDNVQENLRPHITRLRISSHGLPIETLRYKKIPREERICTICNLNEKGDEEHYLLRCKNNKMINHRHTFMNKIKAEHPQMKNLSEKNIIDYCMSMNDYKSQNTTAIYIQNIFKTYREESNVPPLHILCQNYMKKKNMHHGKAPMV